MSAVRNQSGGELFRRSSSAAQRVGRWAVALLFVLGSWAPLGYGEPADDDADSSADTKSSVESAHPALTIELLEERQRLLRQMLAQSSRRYRDVAISRNEAERALQSAEDQLDRQAIRVKEIGLDQLEQLSDQVRDARAKAASLREICDRELNEIRRLVQERELLERRMSELSGAPRRAEPLTGSWEVTWMPGAISGTFYLDQAGTLVTGQYKLGPTLSGSLQGTFVANKLYLQRIDSTRGRDAEIEGVLDADGMRLKGTWQNFELVQGGLPRGQWMARRVK